MKYLTEFRNGEIAQRMAREIHSITTRPWKIMEVCGGQTHSIIKNGIDQMLPRWHRNDPRPRLPGVRYAAGTD